MQLVEFDDGHTFVIAEAGSNWKTGSAQEDMLQCRRLVDVARKAGADAVKFQVYRAQTTYVKDGGEAQYLENKGIKNDINSLFEHHAMPYDMMGQIAKYCNEQGIMFMASSFSVQDAREIDPYVMVHKISSFEINHQRLLEFLIGTEKPLIISTGASTHDEIKFVLNLLEKNNGKNKLVFLQCTSQYPASLDALNLNAISTIHHTYNVSVGFSDHSLDPLIGPLVAVGLGACVIEKHFTTRRSLSGPDHFFALEPTELTEMIKAIREADKTKGDGVKRVLSSEEELRRFATRAIQATKPIKKGDILQEGVNFDVLRPGNKTRGVEPRFLQDIEGKKSSSDIEQGDGIIHYE